MIDLQELVFAFNEYLGRDQFVLSLNTNGVPDEDEKRIVGTMVAGRVPYGFSTEEIDAESLNITFTFDLPCGTDAEDLLRDKILYLLSEKLLSWQKLTIQQLNGTTYYLNTFFEMQPPSAPYVDNGRFTQQIVISGNALLQNANCGAIVGNNEKVYINGVQVLKIEKTSNVQFTGDNNIPLSEDKYIPEIENVASVSTMRLSCLYMGTEIDNEFYMIGEGQTTDPNKVYTIKIEKQNMLGLSTVIEKTAKLTSVTNMSSSGVFLRYEVSFQIL